MARRATQGGFETPSESPPWLRFVPALVFLLSVCAFAPAFRQGFVRWDDDRNFVLNEHWRGLSDENQRWMLTESHIGHWQPLTWMSLALDWEFASGDVPPATQDLEELRPVAERIHAVSVLIHGLSALCVYALIRWLLARSALGERAGALRVTLAAAAGALAFGVHPLRVESVAWATERRDVLAGVFLFATCLVWLRAVDAGRLRGGPLLACLALFVLSLLSKAWGITLPAVLLIWDVWPLRRWKGVRPDGRSFGQLVLEKVPFGLIALAVAVQAFRAQREGEGGITAVMDLEAHGIADRLAQAAYGAVFYVRKTLWPTELAPLYELEVDFDPTRTRYVVSAVLFVLLTVGAWLARKRVPALLVAWLTFLVLASPVLGLLQSGAQIAADRYTYLSCVPFAALFAGGLLALQRTRFERPVAGVVLLALGAAFVATWRQTRVWKDSQTLWEHVVQVEPESYVAQYNLAAEHLVAGRMDAAVEHLQRSIAAHPGEGNVQARTTLGDLWLRQGRRRDVGELYLEGLAEDPQTYYLIQRLEELWGAAGAQRVAELWRAAVAADPDDEGVRFEHGSFLLRQGKPRAAIEELTRAAQLAPQGDLIWFRLGQANLQSGQPDEAVAALEQADRVVRRNTGGARPEYLVALGEAQLAQGRPERARATARGVLRAFPGHPGAQALLQRLGVGPR